MTPSVGDRLTGAYPVLPTPLGDDQSLDLAGLEELVERVLAVGVTGLTVLGSGGEAVYLTEDERRQVLQTVTRKVAGRATVVAGILHFGTSVAVEQGKQFRDLGADALLVALPQPYAMPIGQIISHFSAVVRDVQLPTLYFHQPSAQVGLAPEQVGRLFAEVSLVGIENASLDPAELSEQIRAVGRPISMFSARSADCLSCLAAGGVGTMCPLATLMPRTARKLIDDYRGSNDEGASAADAALRSATTVIIGGAVSDVSVAHWGVKEALAAVGILGSAAVRHPQPGLSEARRQQIHEQARALVEI